jgi:hypothetical protein
MLSVPQKQFMIVAIDIPPFGQSNETPDTQLTLELFPSRNARHQAGEHPFELNSSPRSSNGAALVGIMHLDPQC